MHPIRPSSPSPRVHLFPLDAIFDISHTAFPHHSSPPCPSPVPITYSSRTIFEPYLSQFGAKPEPFRSHFGVKVESFVSQT
jgi:hypothetical protein